MEVLERADGQLMIRYQGESVDSRESPQPPSSLWGAANTSGPDLQPLLKDGVNGHLNQAQRKLLDSLEPTDEDKGRTRGIGSEGGRGSGKPIRHSLYRKPTPAQKARWEAVQKALKQGLSLRANARKLGMARMTVTKYARAKSPPTKRFSAKELAKAQALAAASIEGN